MTVTSTTARQQVPDTYPSREADHPRLIARADPVVYRPWEPDGPLTREQVAFYDQHGYLCFPALFSAPEVSRYFQELERLSAEPGVKQARETILEPESQEVRSIFYVHRTSPVLRRLAQDPRLLDVVTFLLGDRVYLHQSRINYKPGFSGKDFYWHSDFETWHVEDGMPRMRAISCSISLTENNAHNGPLMVIPGSHKTFVSCVGRTPDDHYKSSLRRQEYGVPDQRSLQTLVDHGGIVSPLGPPGTVVLFECNMMHGSNSNITPWPRSNVFFVYNSVGNALVEPYGGTHPRPEFIASREFTPVEPIGERRPRSG